MVSEQEFKSLLSTVSKLDEKQKKQLYMQVKFLCNGKSSDDTPLLSEDRIDATDWLFAGIQYEMKRRGIKGTNIPRRQLESLAPEYAKKAAGIRKALLAGVGRAVSSSECMLLGRLAAKIYLDRLKIKRMKVALRCIDGLLHYFDDAFPDYMSNKMVGMLINHE